MTQSPIDAPARARPPHSRLRFELIVASLLLGLSLFVLPAIIFWVGTSLLGPYGPGAGAGVGTFYGDFYGDLAAGSTRAWALALGPLVMVLLVRLIFLRRSNAAEPQEPVEESAAPRQSGRKGSADGRRIEPRVNLD